MQLRLSKDTPLRLLDTVNVNMYKGTRKNSLVWIQRDQIFQIRTSVDSRPPQRTSCARKQRYREVLGQSAKDPPDEGLLQKALEVGRDDLFHLLASTH